MSEPTRSIYRAEAVRRYAEAREDVVTPQFGSPPVGRSIVLLALLLACGAAVAVVTPIPEHVPPAVSMGPGCAPGSSARGEVRSRRAITLVPLIGAWFAEEGS